MSALEDPIQERAGGSAAEWGPRDAIWGFTQAIGGGDLETATSCFSPEGCFITPDSTVVRGREAIRPLLAQLIEMRVQVEFELARLTVSGALAWGFGRWRMRSPGVAEAGFERSSAATVTLGIGAGSWLLQTLAPWEGR